MNIREEAPTDFEEIQAITEAAFGQPDEAKLIDLLRKDGDAEIALVAEEGGAIVGHIMLSPMSAPVRTLGLGPVSVHPGRQKAGIGSTLIRKSIEQAKLSKWEAIFLLGHTEYYPRFGFNPALAAQFTSPYAGPHFMALELVEGILNGKAGKVEYARAFSAI